MGPWISQYRWWIQQLLQENGCDPKGFIPDGEMGPVPPLHVPIPNPFYPESGT
ncbi:hypothetical protein [Limnofasciculus baicalensis]|uniref:Uncharacterized protein n=1 Tax=Limnofasciculus baicalensis BBK-W-15 TaxID=2699891 RepID=A0AAE3GVG6_9CYAN|nr:hypothetical protein [Limnofasciculus baicalensis]MCP2730628.1 hypothetical protein [Limnofasciculus baicalensis BBK-W-15]